MEYWPTRWRRRATGFRMTTASRSRWRGAQTARSGTAPTSSSFTGRVRWTTAAFTTGARTTDGGDSGCTTSPMPTRRRTTKRASRTWSIPEGDGASISQREAKGQVREVERDQDACQHTDRRLDHRGVARIRLPARHHRAALLRQVDDQCRGHPRGDGAGGSRGAARR